MALQGFAAWPAFAEQLSLSTTQAKGTPSDIEDSNLQSCYDAYIAGASLAITFGVLLSLAIRIFTLNPQWASNFVLNELNARPALSWSWPMLLTFLALSGLSVQAVAFHESLDLPDLMGILTWTMTLVVVVLIRPQVASISIMLPFINLLLLQLGLLVVHRSNYYSFPRMLLVGLALLAAAMILNMPLRPQNTPIQGIGSIREAPKPELRSPEDNITLWQWMTVSWIAPLLALGKRRQLNEDDVWSLPFEFQHRGLHDTFRELSGSVFRRLMAANGLDLVITGTLGLVELVANSAVPVLLQRLLHALGPERKRPVLMFALFSLLARYIAAQANLFGMWYGRRCYERSRGELITMLYEKNLARKLTTLSDETLNHETDDSPQERKARASKRWWSPVQRKSSREKTQKPATASKILNLMRNDAFDISQRLWEFKDILTTPLQIAVSIYLIWNLLGWTCLLGAFSIAVAQITTACMARWLMKSEKRRRAATDQRLQISSQFVEAIRHLRWYGWQESWQNKVIEKRQEELDLLWITRLWGMVVLLVNTVASAMVPVIAFLAFTLITKQPLRVDLAFPAMQLFQMLDTSIRKMPDIITYLLNATIALGRIEDFMKEPDKPSVDGNGGVNGIEARNCVFAWPGCSQPVLDNISVKFSVGMNVIGGKVGAGKTALLLGLLGELDQRSGSLQRDQEPIGYCEQRPWLQSMTIKDNILFHAPFDENRYEQVLHACMLDQDLAAFKHSDLSYVGENGIGLSGGQKARIALARAVYSRATTLMLDDPLSSLDHQTAESIVLKCFAGTLMKDRTLILVTHRLDLCRSNASQYIEVIDGTAHVRLVSELPSGQEQNVSQEPRAEAKLTKHGLASKKFIEDEGRAHGGTQFSVYWKYIKAGRLPWWVIVLIVLTAFQLFTIGRQWFLKEWTEAYDYPGFFNHWPSPARNLTPWLLGFFFFSIGQALLRTVAPYVLESMAYFASQKLFVEALVSVANSTFRFYDVTPVGRLMNRFTSDMGTIDGTFSVKVQVLALFVVIWISSLVVVASITPLFLLVALFLGLSFVWIFTQFLPTSQSLRRLETTSLSPLISDFGALIDGLTTIRVFCKQHSFQSRVIRATDDFQRMDHFYWSMQAWLTYRIDNMSAVTTFLLTMLGLYSGMSPGLLAFALVNAAEFVSITHQLCKLYGEIRMDFMSVERIVELIQLEQEPKGDIVPPASWPTYGSDIVFDRVTVRYAEHLDPALTDISLRIKGGSKTAVVGRTGSGKSTLAAVLLGTIVPEIGSITVDGIDIMSVDKQALRSRVTFLAQDPVLFTGTLRQNLDPLQEHSDHDCVVVLSKVCGEYGWSLNTPIDGGGRNFSQGQRQLIGLARAVLRRSSIVILDEATASIDIATSTKVQRVLQQEMQESTVITIAHRTEAVEDATSCITLSGGKVVEHNDL